MSKKHKPTKKEKIVSLIVIMITAPIAIFYAHKLTENFWIQIAITAGIMAVVGLIIRLVIRWHRTRQT